MGTKWDLCPFCFSSKKETQNTHEKIKIDDISLQDEEADNINIQYCQLLTTYFHPPANNTVYDLLNITIFLFTFGI